MNYWNTLPHMKQTLVGIRELPEVATSQNPTKGMSSKTSYCQRAGGATSKQMIKNNFNLEFKNFAILVFLKLTLNMK